MREIRGENAPRTAESPASSVSSVHASQTLTNDRDDANRHEHIRENGAELTGHSFGER